MKHLEIYKYSLISFPLQQYFFKKLIFFVCFIFLDYDKQDAFKTVRIFKLQSS